MIIYLATNTINGKKYVGKTVGLLAKRRREHYRSDSYFADAIRKHGKDSFEWEIIETVLTLDELNKKEIFWIKEFRSFGPDGYNLSAGGDGGWFLTPEQRIKSNISNKGKIVSKETRDKLSKALKGRTHSPQRRLEARYNMIEALQKPSFIYIGGKAYPFVKGKTIYEYVAVGG